MATYYPTDTTETKREKKFSFHYVYLRNNARGFESKLIFTRNTCSKLFSGKKKFKYMIPGFDFGFDSLFSTGNSKLDKSILIFSLLPIVTCLNCKDCKNSCYARKACDAYDESWNKRLMVTYLAINYLDYLEDIIIEELRHTKKTRVRIHESGDFFGVEYIHMWERIAAMFPHIKLYYYTKVESLEAFKTAFVSFNSLPNVNRVKSILPNGGLNFGSFEYVKAMHEKYNIPVCSYGLTTEEKKALGIDHDMHCGFNCCVCLESEYVLFKEH